MQIVQSQPIVRSLPTHDYSALKAEILRAGVELSEVQLMDLADSLHAMLRFRGPGGLMRPQLRLST